jgi:esterase/lipase
MENPVVPVKKTLSPERLALLQLARQKAVKIRQEQKELKNKEMETIKKQKEIKLIEVEETSPEPIEALKKIKKPKKKIVLEQSSSSDDEPEIVYRKVKRDKPKVNEYSLSQHQVNQEIHRVRREIAAKSLFKPF